MANLTKLLSKQKSKYFWVYIVVGALLMIASIMLMPFWAHVAPDLFFAHWGGNFIKIVIAGVLFLYLFGYLLKKMLSAKITVVKVLTIVEFTLLALIAVGCIVSQFAVFSFDISLILALALWMRGTVEIIRAYYYNNATDKYPIYKLLIAIALVTLGGFILASNFISTEMVLWVATGVAFIFSFIIFVLGFIKNPNEKKQKSSQKN